MTASVGYVCPFVPPEWIAAHGLVPRRVVPRASSAGAAATEGVCPYASAWMASAGKAGVDAVVFTTVCDQMRRAAEEVAESSPFPVWLLNVPATWQTPAVLRYYRQELQRLGRLMVGLGGREPTSQELAGVMREYEGRRRAVVDRRGEMPARGFAEALMGLSEASQPSRRTAMTGLGHGADARGRQQGVPLAVVGGPMRVEDLDVLDMIAEAGGQVVLNATEGGEMTLPAAFDRRRLDDDPLGELCEAYFGAIPHPMRRPNSGFYEYLRREVPARGVRGMLLHRFTWCDTWAGEVRRLRDWSPVPVLELTAGEDLGDRARLANRVGAFVEMLA